MSAEALQNRFDFQHPSDKEIALMWRIVHLMKDCKRRSKVEICNELDVPESTEIGARVRQSKSARWGAWPFDGACPLEAYEFGDSRTEGPDEDGIYRWQMRPRPVLVTDSMQGRMV